jgi:hypothetical protein
MRKTLYERAEPFVVGIGLPVALTLLAIVAPVVFSTSSDVAVIKDDLEEVRALQGSGSQALIRIESSISNILERINQIDSRLVRQEADPMVLVENTGLELGPTVKVRFINDSLWAFPTSKDDEAAFIRAGLPKEQITPVVSGYQIPVTPEFKKLIDSQIIYKPIGNSPVMPKSDDGGQQ